MHKIDFYTAGKRAFEAGKLRVPALDSSLNEPLANLKVGQGGAEMLAAWLQGWDTANLQAYADCQGNPFGAHFEGCGHDV